MWKVALISVLMMASAGVSSAATLDFSELGENVRVLGSTQTITGATLTTDGDAFIVGDQFENSICAASTVDRDCANDLQIDFTEAVTGLSFLVTGFNRGDRVRLRLFDALSERLGTVRIRANGFVDLTSFGTIGSLTFDDRSKGNGFTYSNFTFQVAAVPLPASAWLLLAALGGLGAAARRKRMTA